MSRYFSSATLPSTTDSTIGLKAFRSQRDHLLNLIQHCLLPLSNSLFAEGLITKDVYDMALSSNKNRNEKCLTLLDCIETKIESVSSGFTQVINILRDSDLYLSDVVKDIVHNYCEF